MIRIATVGYLNASPLHEHLDRNTYEVIEDVPSAIAELLARGEVDVALAPVASVLSDGTYRIVPGVAIGSEGPVHSVVIAAETPREQWTKVLLDGESRTSAVLAQVLLRRHWGQDVEFEEVAPGTAGSQAGGTVASLVIGDRARVLPERLTEVVDLGETWTEWTGLPFVFAVWAGRPDLPASVIADLRQAALKGVQTITETYDSSDPDAGGVDDLTYLTRFIRYGLDDRELMGLRRFAALGRELDLVGTRDVVLYGPSPVRHREDVDSVLSRAAEGERLSVDEAVALAENARVADLGAAADLRRRALHRGNVVRYVLARSIDARSAAGRSSDSTLQWASKLSEGISLGVSEVWLRHAEALSGPDLLAVLTQFVSSRFDLSSRALTIGGLSDASEAWNMAPESVGRHLKADGVDALIPSAWPLLDEGEGWLGVVEAAHDAGLRCQAGLTIGSGEGWTQRLRHLSRIRRLQDRTRGFSGFSCHVRTGKRGDGGTASDYAATLALARLFLDNIPHIQAGAVSPGLGTAQTALHMGADTIEAVCMDAEHTTVGGEPVHDVLAELEKNIEAAGRAPMRRVRRAS